MRRLHARERPGYVESVLAEVRRARARSSAGDLRARGRTKGSWWDWDDSKVALE